MGTHEICDDILYVNVMEYYTKQREDCIWEAHREYIDLHYIIYGEEIIQTSDIKYMKIKFYQLENDYVSIEGDARNSIIMRKDNYLMLFPSDAHRTGIVCSKEEKVRKAVFKIKVKTI